MTSAWIVVIVVAVFTAGVWLMEREDEIAEMTERRECALRRVQEARAYDLEWQARFRAIADAYESADGVPGDLCGVQSVDPTRPESR
jgi:hypothetical protein